jgi:hypothetical protein
MVKLYDACKEVGLESKYDNHFFYDEQVKKIFVIDMELDRKQISKILGYVRGNTSLERVSRQETEDGKKEFYVHAVYALKGNRLIENKMPPVLDQKGLEELVEREKKKRKGERAIDNLKKVPLYYNAVNGIKTISQNNMNTDENQQDDIGED